MTCFKKSFITAKIDLVVEKINIKLSEKSVKPIYCIKKKTDMGVIGKFDFYFSTLTAANDYLTAHIKPKVLRTENDKLALEVSAKSFNSMMAHTLGYNLDFSTPDEIADFAEELKTIYVLNNISF